MVSLLKTKRATLKYKRIDGYVQETGMPPKGAPSWCLNKVALERINRSTEVPIYDWDSENGSYNGDDDNDDDNNSPDDIDNRAESSKNRKRKKRKHHKKESKKRKSKKSK